jgi:hypothetical protein
LKGGVGGERLRNRSLVLAILAVFIPVIGHLVSVIALGLAIAAAVGGDVAFAAAAPLIVGVNTFFLSPLIWMVLRSSPIGNVIIAVLLAGIVAPFVIIVLKAVQAKSEGAPNNPATPPDYRSQAAASASEASNSRSWRMGEWGSPASSPKAGEPKTPNASSSTKWQADPPWRTQTPNASSDPFVRPDPSTFKSKSQKPAAGPAASSGADVFRDIAKEAIGKFKGGTSARAKASTSALRFLPSPQVVLFLLLAVAIAFFVPEVRWFFDRNPPLIWQSLCLFGLAYLFVLFGKRAGIAGASICVVVFGLLCWEEYKTLSILAAIGAAVGPATQFAPATEVAITPEPAQPAIAPQASSSDAEKLGSISHESSDTTIVTEMRAGPQFFELKPNLLYRVDTVKLNLKFTVTHGFIMIVGEEANSECSSDGFTVMQGQDVPAIRSCFGAFTGLRADPVD